MQTIIVAPNAFKHSLDAQSASDAICKGFRKSRLNCHTISFPIGDGGDGTCALIQKKLKGAAIKRIVAGPLGNPTPTSYSLVNKGKTAVIDMADASGIRLLKPEEQDPLLTSSKGTGELILHALSKKVGKIILGMGGSATVDGGCGMLHALGVRFLNREGKVLEPVPKELLQLHEIDLSRIDKRLFDCEIVILCDVENLLLGPTGAAPVFGPQKGATTEKVQVLDHFLQKLRKLALQKTGKDMASVISGGTAGGAAAGMFVFAGAQLVRGIDYFLNITQFENELQEADWVVTGEGKIDEQTLSGKGPLGVAQEAKKRNLPVIAMAGSIPQSPSAELLKNFDVLLPINHELMSLNQAYITTEANLSRTAEALGNLLSAGTKM